MKLRGKVAGWWYLIMVSINLTAIISIMTIGSMTWTLIMAGIFAILDIIMGSWTLRNYVLLYSDHFVFGFGFTSRKIAYSEIITIRKTHSMLAGAALSLDRLEVRTQTGLMIISLKENDMFVNEVIKFNPSVSFYEAS